MNNGDMSEMSLTKNRISYERAINHLVHTESPSNYSEYSYLSGSDEDEEEESDNIEQNVSESGTDESLQYRLCDKFGFFIGEDNPFPNKETPIPTVVVVKREMKWIKMLDNWDKMMSKNWVKIRDRSRKGIPQSIRAKAWFYLCAGHKQMNRNHGLFARLDHIPGDPKIVDEIRKDLNRQFPSHEMFAQKNGFGQQDLFRVLKAFSILKPEVGYCQGQAPVAAALLMHMPAEKAFWSLIQICDHYIPGYFSPGLEAIQIHGQMLNSLLKKLSPGVYRLLKKQKLEPVLYMTEWFMCLFVRTLPWPTVLRIWDMFLCEGIKVIFKVALIIMSEAIGRNRTKCVSLYETLHTLRNMPEKYTCDSYLIPKVINLHLSDRDLAHEHQRQWLKRQKEKEKLKREKEKEKKSRDRTKL